MVIRIFADVNVKFKDRVVAHAKQLRMSMKDLIIKALEVELGDYDVREAVENLTRMNAVLVGRLERITASKKQLSAKLNSVCDDRKQIAAKLGVREAAILPRIAELYDEKRLASEKIEVITSERDAFDAVWIAARTECKTFKTKYEETAAALLNCEAKLAAIQKRGVLGWLFNVKPVPVPFDVPAEPVETETAKLREQLDSETKRKEELQDALNELESSLASAGIHPPYTDYSKSVETE